MTVSDNLIRDEGLRNFYKNLGNFFSKAGKKLTTNILRTPGRVFEIGIKLNLQLSLKVQKQFSTIPSVIYF